MATNVRRIHADRAQVWSVLCNGWTYSNWVVGTSHMRAVESAWPGVGTRLFHASGSWPLVARDETVVEECDAGHRLVLTARGRPFGEARIVITLTDADADADAAACTITMHETPVAGPGRWFHNPAAEAVLVRRNTESLARLAALAEARTTPAD